MLKELYEYGIGNTPVVELPKSNGSRILLKLEMRNFLGSIKARTAYGIVKNLPPEAKNRIIVESSSGNLGYAQGHFCKENDLSFICLIDDSIMKKKREYLENAEIEYICVEQEEGFDLRNSRIRKAERMMAGGKYYWVNQYDNPFGVMAHEMTTGPENWKQTDGSITHFVCPMGSGGTIIGTGKYLKRMSEKIKIVGVEPFGSTIYGTVEKTYINAGMGLTGNPGNILHNNNVVDDSYTITDEESISLARMLRNGLGLNVGISSGTAYASALRIADRETGATILAIAPDGGDAYEEYLK